ESPAAARWRCGSSRRGFRPARAGTDPRRGSRTRAREWPHPAARPHPGPRSPPDAAALAKTTLLVSFSPLSAAAVGPKARHHDQQKGGRPAAIVVSRRTVAPRTTATRHGRDRRITRGRCTRSARQHTSAALTWGARAAWRHSARCVGRLYWNSLLV